MYRSGLGDCFLLTIPRKDHTPFYILIDCGVFFKSENERDTMRAVATNIKETTGRIDLLVVTHEHYDHLSGFNHAEDIFKSIEIGKIWFAWTEDPNNALANSIRESKTKKMELLQKFTAHVTNPNNKPGLEIEETVQRIDHVLGFFGAVGSNSTSEAMRFLKEDIKAKKEYRNPGEVLQLDELPGFKFYVLGPPEDVKAINKVNPGKNQNEVYHLNNEGNEQFMLAALENYMSEQEITADFEEYLPFDSRFRIDYDTAAKDPFFSGKYGFKDNDENSWRNIDSNWLDSIESLSLTLDDATNNTSLVLAIEIEESGRVLLFPGDAQVGNWYSWENYTWKVQDGNGKEREVKSADLLARTVFYKVGHHGSHNATMREKGLELMTHPDLVAMIPVNKDFAAKKKPPATGWKMPFEPLLKRLKEKTRGRVIILDEDFPLNPNAEKPAGLTNDEWENFKGSCRKNNLFWEVDINTQNS